MLHTLITRKADEWLSRSDCPVRQMIEYIRTRGELREAQIAAIGAYLFLKIEGKNKPLWQLFCEGFFLNGEDLTKLNINQEARQIFEHNKAARALFEFSRAKINGNSSKPLLPDFEEYLRDHAGGVDCDQVIKAIFYGVDYPDYLFSLPMGAGKTFLMAAFIYLDLYFALNEPENRTFAHNFIILAPSGLKSSIIPSLRTIESFDPSWILPEPAAGEIKRLIKFEILDQPKSAKKSNKARNPNAQKISQHQPFADLMGLVLVTNAEKVILDRLEIDTTGHLFEQTDDEKDKAANELRNLIGKIPNLQILIDEVHHAATDDIKLRQVVNGWNSNGTINSVLGFSGTPYLSSVEKVEVNDVVNLKFSLITNTVYYYPLTRAIQAFLKKPSVWPMPKLNPLEIVRRGVKEFQEKYQDTIYGDGTCAKLAIYCGSIERLEEEIFPFLTGEMKISPDNILKYHRGNATYKLPKENELEFASLDTSFSKKRIILLVQIGKEGWDCRSLTGVILSQKGDCPSNMVLQTSCRCLRQVVRGEYETAGVWLNEDNAKILDKQLREEQHTSIEEINRLGGAVAEAMVERFVRLDYLKLPPVDFYQLKVEYNTLVIENKREPREKIGAIEPQSFRRNAQIIERGLSADDIRSRRFLESEHGECADFRRWLFDISKGGFGAISLEDLEIVEGELQPIFDEITYTEDGARYFNDLYDAEQVAALVRLAFHQKRALQTKSEIIPESARMLIVEKLSPVAKDRKLYPNETDTETILNIDRSGKTVEDYAAVQRDAFRQMQETLKAQGFNMPPAMEMNLSAAVANKDRTFHFLPYDFTQSNFEKKFLEEALTLEELRQRNLELYYNGEKDITDFRILCYSEGKSGWGYVGKYTPDFLLLERKDGKIHRALIIETKGKGFAEQKEFLARKKFVETEFLKMNNEKFGYRRFHYLYLSDADEMSTNLGELNKAILSFFADK
jgi:type III restriction enzyme